MRGTLCVMRRGTITILAIAVASVVAADTSAGSPLKAREPTSICGEDTIFGHSFSVTTAGKAISCSKVRKIVDAPCKVHLKQDWSCFSFQVDDPFIAWFPSDELFERSWSRAILYERYPCSEAAITRELFSREPKGFPTLRQLLADDLIRCDLLASSTFDQVRHLLGPPDYRQGHHFLDYLLGPERDSFFQIDPEYLSIQFSKSGEVKNVGIYQG